MTNIQSLVILNKVTCVVLIHKFHRGAAKSTWLPGAVIQKNDGPNYELSDHHVVRRYADHIRAHEGDCDDVSLPEAEDDIPIPVIQPTN